MHPLSPLTSTNLVLPFHIVPSRTWFADTLKRVRTFYRFVAAEEIESYYYEDKNYNSCCHVCFDDGDRTVFENAFPVLRETKIPATVFLSPKVITEGSNYWFQEVWYIRTCIDDAVLKETICETVGCRYEQIRKYQVFSILKSMELADILRVIECVKQRHNIKIQERHNITKDQMYELMDSGLFAIGAHTMNHPILSNESDRNAEKEIRESLEQLSRMLDMEARYFCYPNGTRLDYGTREQLILRESNVRLAFTGELAFLGRNADPLCLPRARVSTSGEEGNLAILAKLFLLPIWDTMRSLVRFGKTETRERKQIKALAIF